MKEVTIKKYICDFCKKEFNDKDDCWKCECSHSLESRLALVENSIVCPTCKGTGDVDGTDGFDICTCYTCKGKKIVIPKKVSVIEYKTSWD